MTEHLNEIKKFSETGVSEKDSSGSDDNPTKVI